MRQETLTPVYVRISHWINAIAVILMVMSGLKIYNASPVFNFLIPRSITLGGWLGGALLWHFAVMWLLVFNGILYLFANIYSGRMKKKFFPIRATELVNDFIDSLKGKLTHDDLSKYNSIQKLAYLAAIADLILIIASGLVIWKSVQFPILRELLTGFDHARVIHFLAMCFIVFFLFIHLIMVALVPKTLLIMLRGR